jgi:hypothetical protein
VATRGGRHSPRSSTCSPHKRPRAANVPPGAGQGELGLCGHLGPPRDPVDPDPHDHVVDACVAAADVDRIVGLLTGKYRAGKDGGGSPGGARFARDSDWLLTREGVSSVVLGARTVDQLREQLAAASLTLSEEEIDRLDAAAAPGRATVPYYLDDSFADLRPHAYRW